MFSFLQIKNIECKAFQKNQEKMKQIVKQSQESSLQRHIEIHKQKEMKKLFYSL
jgi:hypothetical protein